MIVVFQKKMIQYLVSKMSIMIDNNIHRIIPAAALLSGLAQHARCNRTTGISAWVTACMEEFAPMHQMVGPDQCARE